LSFLGDVPRINEFLRAIEFTLIGVSTSLLRKLANEIHQ
jgi:hypothetical protein